MAEDDGVEQQLREATPAEPEPGKPGEPEPELAAANEETFEDHDLGKSIPMDVEGGHSMSLAPAASKGGGFFARCCRRSAQVGDDGLSGYQRLAVDKKVLQRAIYALRFGIFADAVNATILQPNFPIMVLQGENAHRDSFPSTAPFDFGAAQYFIPMTALIGVAIASVFIGSISDRVGRRPCILVCLYGSVVGSALKFFLRGSFWGFCAANLVNGLVSGTVPVAIAYVGDVYLDKAEKDAEIGIVVAFNMLGTSGGGIAAILMETTGLFTPLWLGAGFTMLSALICQYYLLEPSKELIDAFNEHVDKDDDDVGDKAPEVLNVKVLTNIIVGALMDNLGSCGLMPLALSPLAFEVYNLNFINAGLAPIMSQVAYKWISVMVALMVIPATILTPWVFNKFGVAGGCVGGNVITGVVTIALLYIASAAPATSASFGGFIALLYVAFPFTVFSQLSTGPMLDQISPVNKRGFVQGLNITVMNVGGAIAPWMFGQMSDALGAPVAIWTCIAISFAAAIINVPLMCFPGFGPVPPPLPDERRPLKGEDKEMVAKILAGEWVPAEVIEEINEQRMMKGQPYLVIKAGSYADDRDHLPELRRQAGEDYKYYLRKTERDIGGLNSARSTGELDEILPKVNAAIGNQDSDDIVEANRELGLWFADYLRDAGYLAHTSPQLTKQMIMSAFPVITHDREISAENVERVLLSTERIYRNFVNLDDYLEEGDNRFNMRRVLTAGRSVMFAGKSARAGR